MVHFGVDFICKRENQTTASFKCTWHSVTKSRKEFLGKLNGAFGYDGNVSIYVV